MFFRSTLSTVSFLALASAAFAAPATEEGAARLTATFQTYFSATPGVVSVQPQGETYALTLDFAPLAAQLPDESGDVTVSPLVYQLTDNGDGTWRVTEDQAFAMTFSIPNVMQAEYTAERMVSDGIWDESLATFTRQTATMTGFEQQTVSYGPDGAELSRDNQRTESLTTDMTGKAGTSGGADMDMTYQATGITQTASLPMDPSAPPMQLSAKIDGYTGTFSAQGLRTHELLALGGWFVANPSAEAVKARQDEMRGLLGSSLPLFQSLTGDATLTNLTVDSPVGSFSAAAGSVVIDANGVVSDGRFREAITLEGVSIPAGLVPDWAVQLVPSAIKLDVAVTGFDAFAPVSAMVGAFDLTKPEPFEPGFEAQLLGMFMPRGAVDITLAPGELTGPIYNLTYQGAVSAGPGGMPTGTARITAQGLDKVQEELGKAPAEISGQFMMPMGMAMGLAKDEGGTLVWDLDFSQPGSFKVNGTDLMGGMQ